MKRSLKAGLTWKDQEAPCAWTQHLPKPVRNALNPSISAAELLSGTGDHDAMVEKIIEDAVSRCCSLVLDDTNEPNAISVSNLLDGFAMLAKQLRIELCSFGLQWTMIKALSNIPCVLNASVSEAEVGINELTVRQHLGGTEPIRRSVALVLVGQLSLRLDPSSHHITTQLNIVCKNLSSALRAFTEVNDDTEMESKNSFIYSENDLDSGPEMDAKRKMLGRMTCIGTFGILLNHWMTLAPTIGLRDLGFVMWPTRVLLGITSTSFPFEQSDGELWCRSFCNAKSFDSWETVVLHFNGTRATNKCEQQETQTEWLRSMLDSLDTCKADEISEAFVVNMYNSDECFSLVIGFPNYVLALLYRLLDLLRPPLADSVCHEKSGAALVDLRWNALTLIARFLCKSCFVHDPQTAADFSQSIGNLWGGACSDSERYVKLRDQIFCSGFKA